MSYSYHKNLCQRFLRFHGVILFLISRRSLFTAPSEIMMNYRAENLDQIVYNGVFK